MSDAIVLTFPLGGRDGLNTKSPICSECVNVYFGPRGIYCGMFNEPIMFEDVAEECSEFEPNEPLDAA